MHTARHGAQPLYHRRHACGFGIAMIEKTLAAITIAICLVLMVRLALGEHRRWRFDAALRRAFDTGLQAIRRLRRRSSAQRAAAREAEEAIGRARRRDNIRELDSARRPRKPH
jgi:hypothetical protein